MIADDLGTAWWEEMAKDCKRAADSFAHLHPDANFFRLAQQIAEEQAGLRERPAGLTQWTGSSDAPTTS